MLGVAAADVLDAAAVVVVGEDGYFRSAGSSANEQIWGTKM